jgi:hypothetical protein
VSISFKRNVSHSAGNVQVKYMAPLSIEYSLWNTAVAEWVLASNHLDEPVLLPIDQERLSEIAEFAALCNPNQAHEMFIDAVKSACIRKDSIRVDHLRGSDPTGIPNCCGFLAFLVLAASERGEDGDDRFYQSIGRLLWPERGYDQVTRQEIHMPAGGSCEEPLWKEWNAWLLKQGFVPTARRGQGLRDKFRMYAISQSTLSLNERAYLASHVFAPAMLDGTLSTQLDHLDLESWLRQRVRSGSPRLWSSIHDRVVGRDHAGGHRFPSVFREAFFSDCYEIYESVSLDPDDPSHAGAHRERRRKPILECGLLRIADLDGSIRYLIRPRRPRLGQEVEGGRVWIAGREWYLSGDGDPKWLDAVGSALVDFSPRRYEVEGVPGINFVELPERQIWVPAPDHSALSDEVLISGRRPDPDESFVLLVKDGTPDSETVHSSLEQCRKIGLLDWSAKVEIAEGWQEYRRCRVLLSPWQAVAPVGIAPEIYARLAPQTSDRIRLEGGLRDPNRRGAFMESALPGLTVVTESDPVVVRICRLSTPDEILHEIAIKRGKIGQVPDDLPAGEYVMIALAKDGREEGELDSRRFLVSDWSQLSFDREEKLQFGMAHQALSLGRLLGISAPGDVV